MEDITFTFLDSVVAFKQKIEFKAYLAFSSTCLKDKFHYITLPFLRLNTCKPHYY